jgi:prolyl oligopeptidase
MRFQAFIFSLACVALGSCAKNGNLSRGETKAAMPAPLPESLQKLNAQARALGVTETLHGMTIQDPYRALEQRSALTDAWITAQTQRTEDALAKLRDPAREERLAQLLSIGSFGSLAIGGERVFALVREGQREQAALFEMTTSLGEPLLDPLSHGERAAIDWIYPSLSGRFITLGLSNNGDERSTLRVLDVDKRALLADSIAHAKWSSVAWLSDDSGFYYTRYPAEGEPQWNAEEPDSYFPLVLFHRLGSDPKTDIVVWRSERATDFLYGSLSDDDRYLVLHNMRTWTAIDVHLFDRGADAEARALTPEAAHPLRPIVTGIENQTSGVVHQGQLYLLTNIAADRKRIVRAPVDRAADQAAWQDVVPESSATIEGWTIAKDQLLVHTVENVRSHLSLRRLDGTGLTELPLPTAGSVEGLSADPVTGHFAFGFSSFFYPPAIFAKRGAMPEPIYQVPNDLDLASLEITQLRARSKDGTEVPVHLVHKKGMARDAKNPVLLTGYGGFNVALLPDFTRNALYWIERGGVYAVANLRGGSEFGESWHRAGMLEHKQHVFEDFEAVLELLSTSKISAPERIAIMGGSNGGLLVAAAITRAPQRFAAAIANVGLYDMLRYHLFPPAQIWTSEYGDPREPDAARWLAAYSPYHHVVPGTRYPAVLIESADHDTRVHWAHSTKLAARLQEAQGGERPVYFYLEKQQGHGAGTRLHDLVVQYSRAYAFIETQLGVR